MAGNTFGRLFKLTSFGESHGRGIGGIIEGVKPDLVLDMDFIQSELDRRRPGQSKITTPRDEKDRVEFLSGVFDGKTTGTPLAFAIWNKDQKSGDYDNLKDIYRPSHADYTYEAKYGIRDHRGGGRSSARETIARVVAGAIAKLMLKNYGVDIKAFVSQVGEIKLTETPSDLSAIESNFVRCPDPVTAERMIEYIDQVRLGNDSVGGVVSCIIKNSPVGLGDPVFDKLHATLGQAMLSINAVKGFEYGMGFKASEMRGSQHNDEFYVEGDNNIRARTNRSGGIQGGISNGEDIFFRVAFKPVATILKDQQTVDKSGKEVVMKARGRHDPCVVPRAVPIVEAMAAMVIVDALLMNKTYQ